MQEKKRIITPLSVERHSGKFWRRYTGYDFVKAQQFASLTAAELSMAVQTLPLCFRRREDRFYLSVLLSLAEGENHFVNPQGRWTGVYVPACFRSHPFYAGRVAESDKFVLCVDEACGLVSDNGGLPFFGSDGQLSAEVVNILEFLQKVENHRIDTQRGVDALAEAGTVVEWPLKVNTEDGEIQVDGLYRFDESRLAGLEDAAFLKLRATPAIAIGYGQLYSMVNVRVVVHLANARKKQAAEGAPAALDIEKMLDGGEFINF